MKIRLGFNAASIFLALFFCAFFPFLLIRRSSGGFDELLEVLGVALILCGQLLRISARGYKAERSNNGNALVTDGPYGLIRNPMYLGILLVGIGIVCAVGRFWALLIFLVGFFLNYWYLFACEEAALEKLFGAAYKEYKRRVPRIIPSVGSLLTRDIRDILPLRITWFKREMLSIILVLAAVMAIESWEEVSLAGWQAIAPNLSIFVVIIAVFFLFALYLARYNEKISKNSNSSL